MNLVGQLLKSLSCLVVLNQLPNVPDFLAAEVLWKLLRELKISFSEFKMSCGEDKIQKNLSERVLGIIF